MQTQTQAALTCNAYGHSDQYITLLKCNSKFHSNCQGSIIFLSMLNQQIERIENDCNKIETIFKTLLERLSQMRKLYRFRVRTAHEYQKIPDIDNLNSLGQILRTQSDDLLRMNTGNEQIIDLIDKYLKPNNPQKINGNQIEIQKYNSIQFYFMKISIQIQMINSNLKQQQIDCKLYLMTCIMLEMYYFHQINSKKLFYAIKQNIEIQPLTYFCTCQYWYLSHIYVLGNVYLILINIKRLLIATTYDSNLLCKKGNALLAINPQNQIAILNKQSALNMIEFNKPRGIPTPQIRKFRKQPSTKQEVENLQDIINQVQQKFDKNCNFKIRNTKIKIVLVQQ